MNFIQHGVFILMFVSFSHSSFAQQNLNSRQLLTVPSVSPSPLPTSHPTLILSPSPTIVPSPSPTIVPSPSPTIVPSPSPTLRPSLAPSLMPTLLPSISIEPSSSPTLTPTELPSISVQPTYSLLPSPVPTPRPTLTPTSRPTLIPTSTPTPPPTPLPTLLPTLSTQPTLLPSHSPTFSAQPTYAPTQPSQVPSPSPSFLPTPLPSTPPSPVPSPVPTDNTFVSVIVSVKLYVNLASSTSSTPTTVQQQELKSQLANLTGVPESRMYGFTLSLDPGAAPTPAPTNVPTPVPTPVPTGICGCPVRYYNYFGTYTDQKKCSALNPEALDPYLCCQYCCVREGASCSVDYSNTTLYGRRRLDTEDEDTLLLKMEEGDVGGGLGVVRRLGAPSSFTRSNLPAQRHLAAYYWDVNYKVLASAAELGYDSITSTELATSIFSAIQGLAVTTLKLTDVISAYPETAGSNTLVAQGVTRSPTPQPSSPAPSRTPTHLPSQSVVPTFVPTSVPIPAPVALPTLPPSHAPTKYHIVNAEIYVPETTFGLKLFVLVIPLIVLLMAILMTLCVRYCREICWCCFPVEGLEGLVMFSSFAGNEASAAKQDEHYVKQHREGAVYTWAKQFHAKYLVMGTPTGLKLGESFREVEMAQMEPYTRLLHKGKIPTAEEEAKEETAKNDELLRVIDDGGVILPKLPKMAKKYDGNGDEVVEDESEQLGRLESIAVKMAMKQQELVNALMVAEERQNDLHEELSTLRNSKGKRAKLNAISQSTMELGGGEHSNFLDDWLSEGALIDGNVKDPPTYTGGLTEEEQQVKTQIKAASKAKKKAAEAKARRRSQRMSFRRSASFSSNESGEEGGGGPEIDKDFSSIAKKVANEVEKETTEQEAGWGSFFGSSLI